MTRHFRVAKDPHRGLHASTRPEMRLVLRRYGRARQRRAMQLLPDFFLTAETRTLRVLLTAENIEDVRWELAIILRDDGSIEGTEWISQPSKERWLAVAGLLNIHASVAEPMARIIDANDDYKALVREMGEGVTVENALQSIIEVAREWADLFRELFENGEDPAPMLRLFKLEVARVMNAAEKVDAFLARRNYSITNHAHMIASCM